MSDRLLLPEPVAAMVEEHQALLAMLDDLSDSVATQDAQDTGKLAELLSSFLHCMNTHVYKEEMILFPHLRVALGSDVEALEVFEVEHATVSSLLGQFSDLAKRLTANGACDPEHTRCLAELTSQAREVMPPHIFKEDNVLYPLASQIIPPDVLCGLAAAASNLAGQGRNV